MRGDPWSEREIALLLELRVDRSLSYAAIGAEVGRSEYAVQAMVRKLDCPRRFQSENSAVNYENALLPFDEREFFEDDPRACRREAPWRGDPVAARSPHGSAAAMCAMEAAE